MKRDKAEVILWKRAYLVKKVTRDGTHLILEDEETGEPEKLSPSHFWALYEAGELELDDHTLDHLPARFLDALDRSIEPTLAKDGWASFRRFKYCVAVDAAPAVSKTDKGLQPIIDRVARVIGDIEPPHPKTVARWLRERGVPGKRFARFMSDGNSRKGRTDWLDPEVDQIVETAIEVYWKNNRELRPKEITEAVHGDIAVRNLTLRKTYEISDEAYNALNTVERRELGFLIEPWDTTIRRRLERYEGYETTRRRSGKCYADTQFQGVGRAPKATRVNEVWYIDHTKLDGHLVYNRKTRLPLGRPWLTVVIDAFSRLIVGFFISFIPPSLHSVSLALKNAISPKAYVLKKFPQLARRWLAMGLPRYIVCDRALEFRGNSFELACAELGIEVVWCPRKRPEWKGIVERTIRTINTDFVELLPGATKGDARKLTQQGRSPIAEAELTSDELDREFHKWVIEVYPYKFKTQSLSRGKLYENGIRQIPPMMPKRVSDLGVLGISFQCILTRKGVHFRYLRFCEKNRVFDILDRAKTPKVKVTFTVDPDSLKSIIVRDPTSGERISLPCCDPERVEGLSLWEYGHLVKYMRYSQYDLADREHWLIAKKEIRDTLMASLLKRRNKIATNSTIARRLNVGAGPHAGATVLNRLIDEESNWLELDFLETVPADPNTILEYQIDGDRSRDTSSSSLGSYEEDPGASMKQFGRGMRKMRTKRTAQKPRPREAPPSAEAVEPDDDLDLILTKYSRPHLSRP
ncbi:transposase family protein [Microvirga sp. HBU67558]|uniref:integrase catalytic domain-containing protein n=1 Tax=Microvirga TaxID=186650 RepID=UPI001B359FEE|nr:MULTISPECIES: DDE-type integrase/transposase/recombinase [unclassified Microvirga]MBQ0822672.1 transposase family protein [Microvirga sp. HBU67558]